MSHEDLGNQLNAAYLNKLVDHTLTQLDQVVRDRENQTPEVEFVGEHPSHSFRFECKQISAWFNSQEIDALRKTIQDTYYWKAEAHVLLHSLLQLTCGVLMSQYDSMEQVVGFIGYKLAVNEEDTILEEMAGINRYAYETIATIQEHIEIAWASENARTASQWQEDINTLHRIAERLGQQSRDIEKTRQGITDEQYWQYEVEALKPHRLQREYGIQQSARLRAPHVPKPASSANQSNRVLRPRTHLSPGNPSRRKDKGDVKTGSSTLKPKPKPQPKPLERRRSARLQQLAERAQRQGPSK